MKARVKATGKIIEAVINKCAVPVQGCGASSIYQGNDGNTYYDTELDFVHVYPDWQQVRIQAAIAMMQTTFADVRRGGGTIEDAAKAATRYADALIEELQKKQP